MRILVALAVTFLLGGCTFLDQLALHAQPSLDPNRIYLGTSRVTATAREVARYGCTTGPMYCEQSGINFDCRCP